MATSQDGGGNIRSQTKQGLEQAREKAGEAAQDIKQRGKERLERGKNTAADQVEQIASAVGDVAGRLGEQNSSLATYAADLGQRMNRVAESLRNRSVDELAREVQTVAYRNPRAFLVGSVALGLVLGRMLRLSARHAQGQPGYGYDTYGARGMRGDFGAGVGSDTYGAAGSAYGPAPSGQSIDTLTGERRGSSPDSTTYTGA